MRHHERSRDQDRPDQQLNTPAKPSSGPRKRFGDEEHAERREHWHDDEDRR